MFLLALLFGSAWTADAVNCPDLPVIPNLNTSVYSATPHSEGSTVTINCMTTPFIFIPTPISAIPCIEGSWESLPNCTELPTFPHLKTVVYSATPHSEGSTVTINCMTSQFTFIPTSIAASPCIERFWESSPNCTDPNDFLTIRGCSSCSNGCEHKTWAISLLFWPIWCIGGAAQYLSGDFNGDGYCDSYCHLTTTQQLFVLHYNNVTRSHVKPLGSIMTENSGLFVGSFCRSNATVILRDVNRDGYSDVLCTEYGPYAEMIWGKLGGILSVSAYTTVHIKWNEIFCTVEYPEKKFNCDTRCSHPTAVKFGRFCYKNFGATSYNHNENRCAEGTNPYIEDTNDLYWFHMARSYFGIESIGTWIAAKRDQSNKLGWTNSGADFFPWKSGYPNPSHNCSIVNDYTKLEILSEDCDIPHKQLCQLPTAAPAMCPAREEIATNETVEYSLLSSPENSLANVTCTVGYKLNDTSTNGLLTCAIDFRWTPPVVCIKMPQCLTFTIIDGEFIYDETTRLGKASCNAGFDIRGLSELRCDQNGIWEGPVPPVCESQRSMSTFEIYHGKSLAEFDLECYHILSDAKTDLRKCLWKCADNQKCSAVRFNDATSSCDLFAINPNVTKSTFLSTTSNIKLIIYRYKTNSI